MSDCCGDHPKEAKQKVVKPKVQDEKPNGFVEKYLYKLGKKEMEKNKTSSQKGCC